jgi:hypothetical protein
MLVGPTGLNRRPLTIPLLADLYQCALKEVIYFL